MQKKEKTAITIGIDPGSESSGVIVFVENRIREGYNIPNEELFGFIEKERSDFDRLTVIIEDVRPYNMRITNGIIDTIKFIGQIEWRLNQLDLVDVKLIPRWHVKQWVFVQYKSIVLPMIEKKIDRWALKEQNKGKTRPMAKFIWVEDRMIQHAMRKHWKIEKVKGFGKKVKYNLKDHSWQALALVSYYLGIRIKKIPSF